MYYKVLKGLLACSLATTVFAPIALATNAESRDQSWLDRTDNTPSGVVHIETLK